MRNIRKRIDSEANLAQVYTFEPARETKNTKVDMMLNDKKQRERS